MKTSYDLSFLNSSKNPRQDNWIGQPFVLSYLLSEPGTNFMFRYQPYSLSHSRITQDRIYAGRHSKEGDVNGTYVDGVVNRDQRGIKLTERPMVEVNRVLEAITQHGFHATLEDASAVIESLLMMDKNNKDGGIDVTPVVSEQHIIDKYINPVLLRSYISGSRAEQVKDTILHIYRIASMNTDRIGHVSLVEIMKRIDETDEVTRMGQYILGYMDQLHDGTKSVHKLGLRDSDNVARITGLLNNVEKREKYLQVTKLQFASRYKERKGQKQFFYDTSARLITHDGIVIKDVIEGTTSEQYAWVSPLPVMVNKRITLEGLETTHTLVDAILPNEARIDEDDTLYAYGVSQLSARLISPLNVASHGRGKEVRLTDSIYATMQKTAGARIDMQVSLHDGKNTKESDITEHDEKKADHHGRDAGKGDYNKVALFDEKVAKDSANNQPYFFIDEIVKKEAWLQDVFFYVDDKLDKDARIIEQDIEFFDKQKSADAWIITDHTWLDLLPFDARIDWDASIKLAKMNKDAWIVDEVRWSTMIDEKVDNGAWIEHRFQFFEKVNKSALEEKELIVRVDKLHKEGWKKVAVHLMDRQEKASMLAKHWDIASKKLLEAYEIEENIRQQISTLMDKEAKAGRLINDVEKVVKEMKPALIIEELRADEVRLNAMMTKLLDYGDRPDVFDTIVQKLSSSSEPVRHSVTMTEMNFGERDINLALVEQMILANDEAEDNGRDALIVEGHFLIQDQSDWDDIWNRRVTGVDILDPPDSDYDYSKLASQVYNLETGVPYKPMSPTNVPDVRVRTPLHHPMPEHFDIGVDPTRELVVDNNIFKDVVLALESLKFRNKLRYAGMPAEKAMRELFSKLFLWIQEANPDSDEYKRMFRFARWYAESAVLKLSEHILHRTYNSWVSEIETGKGLGVQYTNKGWFYFAPAYAMQTQSTEAVMSFEKENYIDGQIILMGYFDNPLAQGTMELKVDGETVDSWSSRGTFKRVIDVEQGAHKYDIVFKGDSGVVSISRIEVTGCEFVSAYTSSDDSNTNGLKAIQTLIDMLLSYFDLHHGDDKIKGTMEVKQRRVWNVQT